MKSFYSATLILVLSFSLSALVSCEKFHRDEDENENQCPIVAESMVPQAVKDSFAVRFPSMTVQTWFYKDSSSYCALSGVEPQEQLAQFAVDGSFIKLVSEAENEAAGEPSTDTTGGIKSSHYTCECEMEHHHHD